MRIITGLTFALLMALNACISEKSVSKKFYIITMPDEQEALVHRSFETIQGSCEIERVQISPAFESNRIVNRSDSHEITYYEYHQWAVRPSLSIDELIGKHVEASGIFSSVSGRFSRIIPDFRLSTSIHQMEVLESKHAFAAHVSLEFRVYNNQDNRLLLQHAADRTETLSAKDLNLFANEISTILLQELQTFIEHIDAQRSAFEQVSSAN
jgi:ABC-type uncharacterized transport system auxiliary subunit